MADYSIDALLAITFNEKNLTNILNTKKPNKVSYIKVGSYSNFIPNFEDFTTIHNAVQSLLLGQTTKKNNLDFISTPAIKYNDGYFFLNIYPYDGNTKITLTPLGHDKTITFNDKEYFDFAWYCQALLNLCQDFPILKIETIID